ncbi:MAG: hypothetical protein GX790_06995 [Syntrophomonadaceae bacterium]|nr:hypothetical protein [Syntrophomonadaceae bacterium]
MLRKILVLVITLVFLLPVLPANAEPVGTSGVINKSSSLISEEAAIESFRKAFPLQTKGFDFVCEYQEWPVNGHPSWEIRMKGYDRYAVYRNDRQQDYVGGVVDAITGEVLSLTYRPSIEYYRNRTLALNRDQALLIAAEFLEKMHPDKISQLKLKDTLSQTYIYDDFQNYYGFTWQRLSDGVLVSWDNIVIGVDAYSGMIVSYNYIWHDMELTKPKNILDVKQVTDKVMQEIGLYLNYNRDIEGPSKGLKLIPGYLLNTSASYVDAINGTLLDYRGNPISEDKIQLFKQEFSPINPNFKLKEEVRTEKISITEAMNIAQEFFAKLGYTGEIRHNGYGTGNRYGFIKDEYWSFSPKDSSDIKISGLNVSVDSYTGAIRELIHHNRFIEGEKKNISEEEALAKAKAFIEKHQPEMADLIILNQNHEVHGSGITPYIFVFDRLVNGIPIHEDNITIHVDPLTGDILEYLVNWYPIEVEPVNKILNKQDGIKIFQEKLPLELVWFQKRNESYEPIGEPVLAYRLPTYQCINAFTGEIIQSTFDEYNIILDKNIPAPLDLLYENGLSTEQSLKNPQEEVTRYQALIALMAGHNYRTYTSDIDEIILNIEDLDANSKDIRLIKQAVHYKVIDNKGKFNPEMPITREELAVWAIKSLGLNEVALMKNQIAVPFNDAELINADKQNYIGLAYGLGLIKPDADGHISISQSATWEDLAICVTRIATLPIITN